jgi:hypothetical protein
LRIAKLERQLYGPRSERLERLIDQLAMQLAELEANATEDELAAESAVAKTTTMAEFTRKRSERNTFQEHLLRERMVIALPTACNRCGGTRLRRGEGVTRNLESIPPQWKVIETATLATTATRWPYQNSVLRSEPRDRQSCRLIRHCGGGARRWRSHLM